MKVSANYDHIYLQQTMFEEDGRGTRTVSCYIYRRNVGGSKYWVTGGSRQREADG